MKPEVMKFDFKQQMEDTLDLYIYSEVVADSFDWWNWQEVKSETSQDFFREQLAEYPNVSKINLYINSAGGSVYEGYGIYAQLKRHPAYITAYVDGFANSISSIITMSANKVIMRINSVMGIHNMSDYCFGTAQEHRKCAEDLDKLMEGNRQIYMTKSGGKITLEKLTELLDNETFLTAQECLEYGLCDEISEQEADVAKVATQVGAESDRLNAEIARFNQTKNQFSQAMQVLAEINIKPVKPQEERCEPKEETIQQKTRKYFNFTKKGNER